VNFIIPNASSSSGGDATESALFGVSLVFHSNPNQGEVDMNSARTQLVFEESNVESKDMQTPVKKTENPEQGEMVYDADGQAIAVDSFASPIFFETPQKPRVDSEAKEEESKEMTRKVKVSMMTPTFKRRLEETSWVDRAMQEQHRDLDKPITIGLALVSRRNVILAMRETLSRLLFDYSRGPSSDDENIKPKITCGALINVLGAFSYQDVENTSLRCILEPYLRAASSPWIDRPFWDQKAEFETLSFQTLTECLPPTPLALMFVAALLEQKIVLSSSRRSTLHSAATALAALLRPLRWSHLLVPLVPATLAQDLLQYPAPFILGIPSEDADNMNLLSNLPPDVTLVDLDVGRVILAPAFGHDNEMVRGSKNAEATVRALRSQVLYLAQALGCVFGSCLRKETWCSDRPSFAWSSREPDGNPKERFDSLRAAARSFIDELLEGTWISIAQGQINVSSRIFESQFCFVSYSRIFTKRNRLGFLLLLDRRSLSTRKRYSRRADGSL
jgi:hypothetical protein